LAVYAGSVFFIRQVYVMKLFDDATSFCNEGAYTVIVVCVATWHTL